MRKRDCRKTHADDGQPQHAWIEPVAFADLLTCDHKIVAEKDHELQSKSDDRVALVITDYATRTIDAFPAESKNADEVYDAYHQ